MSKRFFFWRLKCVFSCGQVFHGEANVYFAVYSRFTELELYWYHKIIWGVGYEKKGKPFIKVYRYFKSNVVQCFFVLKYNKTLYDQYKVIHIWDESIMNGVLYCGFVLIKVDLYLLMSRTLIYVAYGILNLLRTFTIQYI